MVEIMAERDSEGVFRGAWEITSSEVWDKDALDLVAQAQIRFDGRQGELAMIAVHGWLDCRYLERDGRPAVEFSWEGEDEGDQRCGRGWAVLKPDGRLAGPAVLPHGRRQRVFGRTDAGREEAIRTDRAASTSDAVTTRPVAMPGVSATGRACRSGTRRGSLRSLRR
jgi:hypothetical protein